MSEKPIESVDIKPILPQLQPETVVENSVSVVETSQKKSLQIQIFLALVIVIGFLVGLWFLSQKSASQEQQVEKAIVVLENELATFDEPSPPPEMRELTFEEDQSMNMVNKITPNPTVENKSGVYTVQLTLLDSSKKPTTQNGYFTLVAYLASRLQFSANEATVYFDTRITQDMNRDNGMFNGQYILWLKSGLLETPIESEDGFVKLAVIPLDGKIIPYLHNPQTNANDAKYCEVNSDCTVRDNICSIDAYNPYQIFVDVYGCGPDGLYETSKDGNCWRKKTLSNPRCMKNTCTATVELGVCQSGP